MLLLQLLVAPRVLGLWQQPLPPIRFCHHMAAFPVSVSDLPLLSLIGTAVTGVSPLQLDTLTLV